MTIVQQFTFVPFLSLVTYSRENITTVSKLFVTADSGILVMIMIIMIIIIIIMQEYETTLCNQKDAFGVMQDIENEQII